jgi:hypothetical protein
MAETKWMRKAKPVLYKDLLWDNTKQTLQREVRESRTLKEVNGEETTQFQYFVKGTGMELEFGTFGQVFGISGTSEQPMWYTSNLNHVIETATSEGRGVDPIFGVCIVGGRVFATNGKHWIGFPPHLKELDPNAKFTVEQVKQAHQSLVKKPFPDGEIDWGSLSDYTQVTPSYLTFEPSLGKVLKFLKYFEIASRLGLPVNLVVPEGEYTKEMRQDHAKLGSSAFNLDLMLSDAKFASQRFMHSAQRLRDVFYPHETLNIINTAQPGNASGLEQITRDPEFRKAVSTFGKYSYGVMNWGEEIGREMDLDYTAMFIGKDGELLTQKSSPSRVIFVHVRDFASFALQAVQAYQVLAEKKGVNWKDRIAIVGVSGASALRKLNDAEKLKYLSVGYRIPDDDYQARGQHTIFLGEDVVEMRRKVMEETSPTDKLSDPLFSYVRAMCCLAYPNDPEARMWLSSYPSRNREERHKDGQRIACDLLTRLKASLKV